MAADVLVSYDAREDISNNGDEFVRKVGPCLLRGRILTSISVSKNKV